MGFTRIKNIYPGLLGTNMKSCPSEVRYTSVSLSLTKATWSSTPSKPFDIQTSVLHIGGTPGHHSPVPNPKTNHERLRTIKTRHVLQEDNKLNTAGAGGRAGAIQTGEGSDVREAAAGVFEFDGQQGLLHPLQLLRGLREQRRDLAIPEQEVAIDRAHDFQFEMIALS